LQWLALRTQGWSAGLSGNAVTDSLPGGDAVSGQIDPLLRVEGRPGARSNGGLAVNGT
jgi:hypothetical protein